MKKYMTYQGDTFDSIAFKQLGDESYMQALIEANPEHVGTFIFDAGVILNIPESVDEGLNEAIPEWRTKSDAQLDAEELSAVDYYSDEEDEDDEEGDYPEEDEGDE